MKSVAIIGSGPAALMLASTIADFCEVKIFEKRPGPSRKLLIAGSSGLNISYDCPLNKFHEYYREGSSFLKPILEKFTRDDWFSFLKNLGIEVFLGSSKKYFVEGLSGAPLVKAWTEDLKKRNVQFFYQKELKDFEKKKNQFILSFSDGTLETGDALCLCLGGGSYEEEIFTWPETLRSKGINVEDFKPSNMGFHVNFSETFLKEVEGESFKKIILTSSKGSKQGYLTITHYGLEGPPLYYFGELGTIHLDLKPDLSEEEILKRLEKSKENFSPMRRVQKYLNLDKASLALVFHVTPEEIKKDLKKLISRIKHFPIELVKERPLEEAISSKGGVDFYELDEFLMVKKIKGLFCAGEMINWDAPTGGFLIQACVSEGYVVGLGVKNLLS